MPTAQSGGKVRIELIAVVAAVLAIVARGIGRGEFNLNQDEPFHAFTGQFIADLIRAHPFGHPLSYVYQYYAHYPAIALGHWPPLFYLVEGPMFLLFGSSVVVARLTVILFVALGLVAWFKLARAWMGDGGAVAATVVFGLLPAMLLFERSVMLEVPALALALWATWFWLAYLKTESRKDLFAFAVIAALGLLTKQNDVYLLAFCILTLAAEKKWRLLRRRDLWLAVAIVAVLAGPYYFELLWAHGGFVSAATEQGSSVVAHPWLYYFQTLPQQLGWPCLWLALAGLATCRWWGKRGATAPALLWILACYLTFNCFAQKEARYILAWLPAWIYFAIGPWVSSSAPAWMHRVRYLVPAALAVWVGWTGWQYRRPYATGYEAAARFVMDGRQPSVVMYDADLSANFAFFARRYDLGVQSYLMRKGLYVERVEKAFGGQALQADNASIDATIQKYGIRFIVVDDADEYDYPIETELRDHLSSSPQFRLAARMPVETGLAGPGEATHLLIYENLLAASPTTNTYQVPMMTMGHDIEVPLTFSTPR